ncbi:Phage-associated protein [Sodalis praecaptivus]|uniref:Phage-associated protein n=1 Tax=Sodalis praecaptivus TaxID=1239307 RepID=W0I0F1_9GAMM|nr:type II toxin-antitoxin system antitoxin SocA domain-containing protein [Sodalis praecaptivus]AHF77935.1 Phage-associated protein [Sodalis praecaptivus]
MAYSAIAVANAFIDKANQEGISDLSQMKLQKLVFFAQSWSLRLYEKPITEDFFAKWTFGPVIPSLYHATKQYGSEHISSLISTLEFSSGGMPETVTPTIPDPTAELICLIDNILKVYGHMTAAALSRLTHLPGSAWSRAGEEEAVLDNQLLKECIVIEEGRFMSCAEFPYNYDLSRIEKALSDDFITVPEGLETLDDFTTWLREAVK